MKRSSLVILALVACTAFLAADRQDADPMEGVRYVDMQRCLEEWPALKAQGESIRATFEAIRNQFQAQEQEIRGREAELEGLEPGSPQFINAAFELELDKQELNARIERASRSLQEEQAALIARGLVQVHQAVAELGARRGYSSIQMAGMELPGPGVALGDQLRDLESRWVLWSNPAYDVTDEVLAILGEGE
jgi:Skp family chaperone for outer membrane proteins